MEITIRPLDPTSDAELAQLGEVGDACDREMHGAVEPRTPAQHRVRLESTPYLSRHHWVAEVEVLEGGRTIAGSATAMTPLQENLEMIDVEVAVHPAFRGQGIGTALVEQALIPAIRASGRPLVSAWGEVPADGDADDASHPANRLAARLGLERRTMAVCRGLDLPVAPSLLDDLAAEAAEKVGDYRILTWQGPVPEEHIGSYGALLHQLELDDPDEDMEYEAAEYPPERIRQMEERYARSGLRIFVAVAVAPDGTFAGNTEIAVQDGPEVTLGYQENTLVMPDHRGHRLGLALKVANHRQLAEAAPGLRRLVTWNSHVNPWMISINERLGYEVVYREIGYQGRPEL